LVAHDLSKRYGRSTALSGVSFEVGAGVTGLVGANGAGKTTLLDLVGGFTAPSGGYVTTVGTDQPPRIGYLPQSFAYPRSVTIEAFVEYSAWVKGYRPRASVTEAALRAANLWDVRRQRLGASSGGVIRRAGFAAAIVGTPEVLLLDEPTTGIDPQHRQEMRAVIRGQADSIVIMSSHLSEDIEQLCAQVLVLADGAVTFSGTPAEARRAAGAETFEDASVFLSRPFPSRPFPSRPFPSRPRE
jgi:ABC-2 type transport system ATP-binding protein